MCTRRAADKLIYASHIFTFISFQLLVDKKIAGIYLGRR
ncbi:hypothetical protein D1AOALGA4SA_353 [Olavius algarvensis Delta 1 endosymbiont]|nr:hypothetical protein D1AOALGA4SA_353 [Olavius algarvensis Delta 1 endosymbiont]